MHSSTPSQIDFHVLLISQSDEQFALPQVNPANNNKAMAFAEVSPTPLLPSFMASAEVSLTPLLPALPEVILRRLQAEGK